ncbi:oxygenase [Actinocatenispora thailandica]|uniref:Oxygenase n=1 Tax=Actinocatenispora thailandica TaxID=227318 RepID=A0A7R7I173_9ACTN|nr:FAD-dependent monooxygenase [Actinocatenispora thailandica]BCJ39274.1 oxygenase [Actinocatenispora thailandica]
MDTEVLVVGAGPTGLALACALRLQGVPVRVIDAAAAPATTSRANILHARGVEVLDRLGALGDLPDRALTALTITQYLDGRPAITVRFGDQGLGTARPALYVSQADLEAELRHRLRELGVRVDWCTTLVGLAQDEDGVTGTVEDGRTVTCRWLAGCDGSHSTVRALTGIGFPGVRISERFLLADVHAGWPVERSGGHGWIHPDGPLFAVPMREVGRADDLWRLMAYDPAPEKADDPHGDEQILDRFRQLLPERTGRTDIELGATAWTSVFRVHRRLADSYRRGRVFLVGDAAHVHSPLGGQGMVTGIGDAENLAWKLALVVAGRAAPALLDSYQAERRPLATEVLRRTTTATRLQVGQGALMRALRDRVLVPAASLPAVQRRASRVASQLWVGYRRGPLAGGLRARLGRRPRPGDRVPDLACTRPDGTGTRLHAELRGRWALLTAAGCPGDLIEAARHHLDPGPVRLIPRPERSDVWLVRPDAHLAWRGKPTEAAALTRWLDDALLRGRAGR